MNIPSRLESPLSRPVNVLADFGSRQIHYSEPALLGRSPHKLIGNNCSFRSSIEEAMKLQEQDLERLVVVKLDGKGGCKEYLKVTSERTKK